MFHDHDRAECPLSKEWRETPRRYWRKRRMLASMANAAHPPAAQPTAIVRRPVPMGSEHGGNE